MTGLYRYVRNPMYVAVVAVILGQAILFGDWRLMTYGALMWLGFQKAEIVTRMLQLMHPHAPLYAAHHRVRFVASEVVPAPVADEHKNLWQCGVDPEVGGVGR